MELLRETLETLGVKNKVLIDRVVEVTTLSLKIDVNTYESGSQFWTWLVYWLHRYEICELLNISSKTYYNISDFYAFKYAHVQKRTLNKIETLRKVVRLLWQKRNL